MKAKLLFAGTLVAIPLAAQVTTPTATVRAPSAPVTAPAAPVTAPPAGTAVPDPTVPSPATRALNPVVPQATAPSSVGRTFETVPAQRGFPPIRTFGNPLGDPVNLGVPPVAAPGTITPTNANVPTAVGPNIAGRPVGIGIASPGTNAAVAPILGPVAPVILPPGTVIRPAPAPVQVPIARGGPVPPPSQRFPNPAATGAAPGADRGTATSPNVVVPPR